jgi:hypothetical protein
MNLFSPTQLSRRPICASFEAANRNRFTMTMCRKVKHLLGCNLFFGLL